MIMLFWHGGNLNDYNEPVKHKKGRYEYGPGLYATTHYDTAKKYAKGSKKLYLLDVQKGKELSKSMLSINSVIDFVNLNIPKAKRKDLLERFEKYNKDNQIPANNFVTIILNEEALKASKMNVLREFLVNSGIDYEMVRNPLVGMKI